MIAQLGVGRQARGVSTGAKKKKPRGAQWEALRRGVRVSRGALG